MVDLMAGSLVEMTVARWDSYLVENLDFLRAVRWDDGKAGYLVWQ